MKQENDFDKMDKILGYLSDKRNQWIEFSELLKIIPNQSELKNLLEMLEGKKYINVNYPPNFLSQNQVLYYATAVGREFILKGGYSLPSKEEHKKSKKKMWYNGWLFKYSVIGILTYIAGIFSNPITENLKLCFQIGNKKDTIKMYKDSFQREKDSCTIYQFSNKKMKDENKDLKKEIYILKNPKP